MADERQETREQELVRVRSYLASQSMRRNPTQLVEVLREAYQQFLTVTNVIPEGSFYQAPRQGEWSGADVLAHVCDVAAFEAQTICAVVERGEQPPDVSSMSSSSAQHRTRTQMLTELELSRKRLFAAAQQADPAAHLDITWGHDEFGKMNWREWLLFARVHTLDHARQMQAIGAALKAQGETV